MKRLSILLLLVALMGINAFAQTSRNSYIQKNLGVPKASLLGGDSRPTVCDTFVNLCSDDTLVLYTASCTTGVPGGYVCGHNCYGDKAKVDIFGVPGIVGNTTIKGVLLFFGVGKAANTTDQFNVRVWDHSGTFGDGGSGAPGTILGSKAVKYNTVKNDVTNGNLTYVQFASAIAFPSDSIFYAGIDFSYKSGDTVALINTLDRTGSGLSCSDINTSVDKFSDNSWHRFTDADDWGLATSQMILPILCSNVCVITITPAAPTICKGTKVTLKATGATTYSWAPSTNLNVTTGSTVKANPTTTTTYTVTGNGGQCTKTVTVTVNSAPTANISAGGCVAGHVPLTRTGTPTTGVTFQWLLGGSPISGATNSTYNATVSGSYQVKVTITATGCTKLSAAKSVTVSCRIADETVAFTAEAYPNPFANSLTVNIGTRSAELATVKLMDFSGRLVREFKNVDVSAPFEINEDLSPGVYFIKVTQGTNEKMLKVVKE